MALGNELALLLKIKGDSSEAVAALNRAERETKDLDNTTKSLGGTLSSFAGPATLAASAVVAIATGALVATKALFDLSVSTAEFGAQIFDASEKTGLTAETLSAIKFAADQSGTSLDAVTAASSRFAKTIGEAGNGSDKAIAKLERLGVTSTDLDTALSQALTTIVKLPPGIEQMTAAQDAFGRSGADLLPFIKSFDGDLAKLTRQAKELGVTIDDEAARAADAFGDQLDTLKAQLAGVGRTIGTELIPVFSSMAKDISAWLAKNKDELKSWGTTAGNVLAAAAEGFRDLARANREYTLTDIIREGFKAANIPGIAGQANIGAILKLFEDIDERGAQIQKNRQIAPAIDYTSPRSPKTDAQKKLDEAGEEDAKKAAEKRAKEREEEFKKELQARERHNATMLAGQRAEYKEAQDSLEEAFLKRTITEQEFFEKSKANVLRYKQVVIGLIKNAFAIDSTDKTGTELETARLEANNSLAALNNEIKRETAGISKTIEDQRKKDAKEQEKDLKEQERNQEKADREKQQALDEYNATYRDLLEIQKDSLKAERDIEDVIANRTRGALQDNIRAAEQIPNRDESASARNAAVLALRDFELAEAARKEAQRQEDLEAEKDAAIARLTVAELEIGQREAIEELYREKALLSEEEFQERLASIRQAAAEEFVVSQLGFFETLELALDSLGEQVSIIDVAADAFRNLAAGIGSAIQQYVLYGKSAPAALRQVLAATLAQIAAEAAVQAIRAAAYGFLFLATGNYAAAGNAFASAALWAGIAVGAALLGRAVAPKQNTAASSSFSSSASGSGGSGSTERDTSNQGQAYSGKKDAIQEANVNQPAKGVPVTITLKVSDDSTWLGKMLKFDAEGNGMARQQIRMIAQE